MTMTIPHDDELPQLQQMAVHVQHTCKGQHSMSTMAWSIEDASEQHQPTQLLTPMTSGYKTKGYVDNPKALIKYPPPLQQGVDRVNNSHSMPRK